MAFKLADRVRETSTTTGTGSLTLAGAAIGYQSFDSALDTGDTTWYAIVVGTSWEVGLGTFTSPSTLARTAVLANSNGDTSPVSFGAGDKDVFVTTPAAALKWLEGFTSAGHAMVSAADVAAQRVLLAQDLVVIADETIASATSVFSAVDIRGYSVIEFMVIGYANSGAAGDGGPVLRLATDSGGTMFAGGSDYSFKYEQSSGAGAPSGGSGTGSFIYLSNTQVRANTSNVLVAEGKLFVGDASHRPYLSESSGGVNDSGGESQFTYTGRLLSFGPATFMQVLHTQASGFAAGSRLIVKGRP